jgi:DNA-binding transcriptional MerR regulator/GGDEF domain-containing protein
MCTNIGIIHRILQEEMMNEPNIDRIRKHFQDKEVQERVTKHMLDARSKATVTISRAAGLFDFSESQLREWEKRGLLKTERMSLSENGKISKGHRQFSPDELDKLALIKELLDEDYSLSEIPQNIDVIWQQIKAGQQDQTFSINSHDIKHIHEVKHIPIDKRVGRTNEEVFWRYFVSQVLRLSLMLLCEDMSDTIAGIIVPLQGRDGKKNKYLPGDQPETGPSLVGWLGENRSFNSFLDEDPSFKFPSDFRIQPLPLPILGEDKQQDNVLIVIQREAKALSLSAPLVETIRRLVDLLYRHIDRWLPCFDYGMRDWEYQITDFTNPGSTDEVMQRLMEMVVELGGKAPNGKDRWHFSLLFLPKDPDLPIQQRNLVVRAQSAYSPHQIGVTTVHIKDPGLSFRAYQSGHIIYRPKISPQDFILAYRDLEESTRSAIAIPIAGEGGLSLAALYIASDEVNTFFEADQRILRVITRMIEELLTTYEARRLVNGKLSNIITNPGLVDISFKEFLSEDDFINNLEALLIEIQMRDMSKEESEEVISFIAIDIDNQGSLSTKYGDRVARNLSREVGLRIKGQLILSSSFRYIRPYHVQADRYYLILKGVSLEEARNKAEMLRKALDGEYRIDSRRVVMGRPMTRENMLELQDVTVRLGVPSYEYKKLKELLQRYPTGFAVSEVRALIMQSLDQLLQIAQQEGGNVIISWDPGIWGYRLWSPSELE